MKLKTAILCVVGILARGVYAQTTFVPLGAVGIGNILSVSFPSNDTGYITNTIGQIFKTTDSGSTWVMVHQKKKISFTALEFINTRVGWAAGYPSSVITTTDGGTTWSIHSVKHPLEEAVNLTDMSFLDDQNGIVVGSFGSIYRTSDGGISWGKLSSGVTENLEGVRWIDSTTIIAVGRSVIIQSRDRGLTWHRRPASTGIQYSGVDFTDNNTGLAISAQGELRWTTDGGYSWSRTYSSGSQKGIAAGDEDNFIIAKAPRQSGIASVTTDGGNTWTDRVLSGCGLSRVFSISPVEGFLVGDCSQVWKYHRDLQGANRLSVSSKTVDHATVLIGTRSRRSVKIWNLGEKQVALHLSIEGPNADQWKIESPQSALISPMEFTLLNIDFLPNSSGMKTATMQIINSDPNSDTRIIQLSGTGVSPLIFTELATLDFGTIPVMTDSTRSVSVKNISDQDRTLNIKITHGGDFGSVVNQVLLKPGQSTEIPVHFLPQSEGRKESAIWFDHGDQSVPSTTVLLSGHSLRGILSLDNTFLDFEDVICFQTIERTIVIENTGSQELLIDSITVSGPNANEFRIITLPGLRLLPGEKSTVVVGFRPEKRGKKDAQLNFFVSDPLSPHVTLSMSGNGVISELNVNSILNFGIVLIKNEKLDSLRIRNTGNSSLVISGISFEGTGISELSIIRYPDTVLLPGASSFIVLRYRPQTEQTITVSLVFESNDKNSPTHVRINGTGFWRRLVLPSGSITFGTIPIFSSVDRTILLENMDTTAHVIPAMRIIGADSSQFIVQSVGKDTLQPKERMQVAFRFVPTKRGSINATLRFLTAWPIYPSDSVLLYGYSNAPILLVSPNVLDFGSVGIDRFHKKGLSIENRGQLPLRIFDYFIAGPDSASFTMITQLDTVMNPFHSTTLSMQFVPFRLGAYFAELHILSNDPVDPYQIIPLTGNSILVSVRGEEILPNEITLSVNVPNPFNRLTEIPFTLQTSSHVRLTVYDLFGRRVSILIDERIDAGKHIASFDGSALPTGIYPYVLESEGRVIVRRMLLLR